MTLSVCFGSPVLFGVGAPTKAQVIQQCTKELPEILKDPSRYQKQPNGDLLAYPHPKAPVGAGKTLYKQDGCVYGVPKNPNAKPYEILPPGSITTKF